MIKDILAAKEMYIGRHYLKKEKWIAAINRFKNVVINYDETIFVTEALHRLVEINYAIGLIEESQKYANVLGYNYLSNDWYKKSYKIFNEDYLINISNFILDVYRSRHVSKTIQKLPFYLRDIIYKIHGMYLASKNKVVFQDVNVLLYELDEKKFCYIINNIEKDMKKKNNREMETSEQS